MAGVALFEAVKRYGEVSVIDRLSLEISSGEFVVFLGPSGCGKSTLLRLIAGLETLDGGEIHVADRRVDNLPPGDRNVAMVFQHYALYPHMTIRENLAFGLKNQKVPADEIARRVDAAAQRLEIAPLLERRPGQLSGGQKQRAAIARAIVKQPDLFLFDEPLSNLDAALRARTRIELAQLHHQLRTTMIFVTHDQVEAMTLADRIVVMNNRKIEQIGTPMDIYRKPATQFVASFVGTPKINILPTTVECEDQRVVARLPDGTPLSTGHQASRLPADRTGMSLGIRPEHVRVAAPSLGTVDAEARVVERLGERTLVYAALSEGTLLVAEDGGDSAVQPGDRIGLTIDGARVHLFAQNGTAFHGEIA